LNTEQLAAVTALDGPILVLAGAGTGKTRTLVHRVAHLVETGVRPDRILLLTFTNRAAREMLERARLLVRRDVSDLWGGTFHHMANRLLRRHADQLGYPHNFTILDRDDAVKLLRHCIHNAKLPPREFPKPEVLLAINSMASNLGASAASLLQTRYSQLADFGADVLSVLNAYTKEKRTLGAMDFDDLLVNGLRLFRGIHVRHDDAKSAVVERTRAVIMLVPGDPHDRCDAGRYRGHRDLAGGVDAHRIMLGIYEQPVESAGPGDGGDIHRARLAQPHAEGQPARLEPGLGAIDLFFHFGSLSLAPFTK